MSIVHFLNLISHHQFIFNSLYNSSISFKLYNRVNVIMEQRSHLTVSLCNVMFGDMVLFEAL